MVFLGCLDRDTCDSSNVELYAGDSLTLEGTATGSRYQFPLSDNNVKWNSRVVVVRQNGNSYSDCSGCTMTIQFTNYSTPFNMMVTMLEANYTSASYVYGGAYETVFLTPLVGGV